MGKDNESTIVCNHDNWVPGDRFIHADGCNEAIGVSTPSDKDPRLAVSISGKKDKVATQPNPPPGVFTATLD